MFYNVRHDEGKRKKYAEAVALCPCWSKEIQCTVCHRQWKKPLYQDFGFELPIAFYNDNFPDFTWNGIQFVSEKAALALQRDGITGFTLEEAVVISGNELSDEQKKELRIDGINIKKMAVNPPKYFKLHVAIGADLHEDSNRIRTDYCEACGYESYIQKGENPYLYDHAVLRMDSLVSTDIFMSIGYGYTIFCTERFRQFYDKYELTGLFFTEIEVK